MSTITIGRRTFRWLLIGVAGLLLLLGLLFAGLYIHMNEPYLSVTEVRAANTPETVEVAFIVACEDAYFADERFKYDPLLPDETDLPTGIHLSGNRFVFTGYPYKLIRRNIFTGAITERRSERLDVFEWHMVTPYRIWNPETGEEHNSDAPLGWRASSGEPVFVARTPSQTGGCS